ncbi:MAG: N(4)-(beta-N-acetylglucosaminyl)-L-asparaginase [Cytophagales bacterium]|nr:N(4)-(beta-N-acetylglucosaminyl)-L-asparaginase [Cytophagales bacterium]
MSSRRRFIKNTTLYSAFGGFIAAGEASYAAGSLSKHTNEPIVISTWNHGLPANAAAWEILNNGGKAIDAVEAGVKVPEADPNVRSVGYGGYPDRDGNVTLDACIMDENQQCGSVACLEHIKHPISVARLVMDKTPHVMLVGEGALEFAMNQGFKKENLLTPESLKGWRSIRKELETKKAIVNIENERQTIISEDNHDTIGMLALDVAGNLSGSCTTSGAANKLHGRVGDSPIIGAGLFVDNEIGAACATGLGEEVIKQAGSAMVVELMRNGRDPESACKEIVQRIIKTNGAKKDLQVGFLALRKDGAYGAFSILKGFNFAVFDAKNGNKLIDSPFS